MLSGNDQRMVRARCLRAQSQRPWVKEIGGHAGCVDAIGKLRLPLLTSEADLTEAFHVIWSSKTHMETVWGLFTR